MIEPLHPMKFFSIIRTIMAAPAALLLASCSTMVVDGVSLAKHSEIQRARTVAISQSPELLYITASLEQFSGLGMKSTLTRHRLPGEAVAGGLIQNLPASVKGKLVPFEAPTRLPPTMSQRFLIGNHGNYHSVSPRRDADLIVILVPSGSSQSSGYYNPAAGAYISGGSSEGGHWATLNTIGSSNVLSRLDALVFSGADGSFLGETSVIATLNFKELTEAHPIADMCSKSLAKSIFGVR